MTLLFKGERHKKRKGRPRGYGFSKMWNLPFLRTKIINLSFLKNSLLINSRMDKGWLELYGGKGGEKSILGMRRLFQKGQFSLMLKRYFLTRGLIMLIIFILS
jgi:hypothetical protein